MNQIQEQAKEKLRNEAASGRFSNRGAVMKSAVLNAMVEFCDQNEEFARAVLSGGALDRCMKHVEAGIKGNAISDLDVCRRAAEFYFPGCRVQFRMEICMSEYEQQECKQELKDTERCILNLSDFL